MPQRCARKRDMKDFYPSRQGSGTHEVDPDVEAAPGVAEEPRVEDLAHRGWSRRAVLGTVATVSAFALAGGLFAGLSSRGNSHNADPGIKQPVATGQVTPGEHTPTATATSVETTAPSWDKTNFPFQNIGPVTIDGSGNATIQVASSPESTTTGLDAYSSKLAVVYDASKFDQNVNPNLGLNNGAQLYENAHTVAQQGLVNMVGAAAAYNRNFSEYKADGYTTSNMYLDAIKTMVDTDPASAGSVDVSSGSDLFNTIIAGVLEDGLRNQTINTINVGTYVGMVSTDERFNDGRMAIITGNKITVTLADGTKTDVYARINWTNEKVDGQDKWVVTAFQTDPENSVNQVGYGDLAPKQQN